MWRMFDFDVAGYIIQSYIIYILIPIKELACL